MTRHRRLLPSFSILLLLTLCSGCALFKPRAVIVSEIHQKTVVAEFQTEMPALFSPSTEIAQSASPTVLPTQPEPTHTRTLTKTAVPSATQIAPSATAKALPPTEAAPTEIPTVQSIPAEAEDAPEEVVPVILATILPTQTRTTAPSLTQLPPTLTPTLTVTRTLTETAVKTIVPIQTRTPLPPTATSTLPHTLTPTELPVVGITPFVGEQQTRSGMTLIDFAEPEHTLHIQDTCSPDAPKRYTFMADGGQFLLLTLTAPEQDVTVALLDAFGANYLENIARLRNVFVRIPKTGWYTLLVQSDAVDASFELETALPQHLALTEKRPATHLAEELATNSSWRFTIELEKGFFLDTHLKLPAGADYSLQVTDIETGAVYPLSGKEQAHWLSEKDSGSFFLIELTNLGAQNEFDFSFEQLKEVAL